MYYSADEYVTIIAAIITDDDGIDFGEMWFQINSVIPCFADIFQENKVGLDDKSSITMYQKTWNLVCQL